MGLGEEWLGVILDHKYLDRLLSISRKYGISPVGEGGEFETFVLDAPHFRRKIRVLEHEKHWYRDWGVLYIRKAILVDKSK